jgi:hypothetical protein
VRLARQETTTSTLSLKPTARKSSILVTSPKRQSAPAKSSLTWSMPFLPPMPDFSREKATTL